MSDSLASCSPLLHRRLPLKVGRIDATSAGPAGVPGPADNLTVAMTAFTRAGFTQTEMIQAVACGHSVGGVHGSDFQDIGAAETDDNTSGRAPFDTTPAVFDNNNVNEYLTQTGLKGGPLVVGLNSTENSDARIFRSDGNATVTAMNSATSFSDTCFTIFDKMLNTVPDAVTLSDEFTVRPWIMRESHLDLTAAGELTFSGTIAGWGTAPPATATYQYGTTGGGNTGSKTTQPGVTEPGFFNNNRTTGDGGVTAALTGFNVINDYAFSDLLSTNPVTSISITSPGATYSNAINTNIFILVSQSFMNFDGPNIDTVLRVAVLNTLSTKTSQPIANIFYTISQTISQTLLIESTNVTMTFEKTLGNYNIFRFAQTIPGSHVIATVKLGTTLVSARANVGDLIFSACPTTPFTSC